LFGSTSANTTNNSGFTFGNTPAFGASTTQPSSNSFSTANSVSNSLGFGNGGSATPVSTFGSASVNPPAFGAFNQSSPAPSNPFGQIPSTASAGFTGFGASTSNNQINEPSIQSFGAPSSAAPFSFPSQTSSYQFGSNNSAPAPSNSFGQAAAPASQSFQFGTASNSTLAPSPGGFNFTPNGSAPAFGGTPTFSAPPPQQATGNRPIAQPKFRKGPKSFSRK
jgi:hypothetical protein